MHTEARHRLALPPRQQSARAHAKPRRAAGRSLFDPGALCCTAQAPSSLPLLMSAPIPSLLPPPKKKCRARARSRRVLPERAHARVRATAQERKPAKLAHIVPRSGRGGCARRAPAEPHGRARARALPCPLPTRRQTPRELAGAIARPPRSPPPVSRARASRPRLSSPYPRPPPNAPWRTAASPTHAARARSVARRVRRRSAPVAPRRSTKKKKNDASGKLCSPHFDAVSVDFFNSWNSSIGAIFVHMCELRRNAAPYARLNCEPYILLTLNIT